MVKFMQMEMSRPLGVTIQLVRMVHVWHEGMVYHESRFTYRLHPRGLKESMSITMRIWRCIDYLLTK
jgi:predicted transcriptional regulator